MELLRGKKDALDIRQRGFSLFRLKVKLLLLLDNTSLKD